jgi:signal transduction histidine kinase
MNAIHGNAVTADGDPAMTTCVRVLLVEDDDEARHALASMLHDEGFVVETARDGAHALEVASVFAPDVVLTDLERPGMDGIELSAHLHAERPHLPVLVMTAFREMQATVRGLRAGAAARAANEEVLSIVSHDLRTPLSLIQTALPLLLESAADAKDQAAVRRTAEMIMRASTRMSRLIEDLLDRTRIDGGILHLDRANFRLADLLADVADLEPLALEKQIRLDIVPPPDGEIVFCDRARIDQVLFNLVSNAIKYSRGGTNITVSAERMDHVACFMVRDQGRGMASMTLSKIFDRFWQPADTHHTGLGLGLYIAKGIVEAHGGTIRAESTVGEGSTFYCFIPD